MGNYNTLKLLQNKGRTLWYRLLEYVEENIIRLHGLVGKDKNESNNKIR